MLVPHACPPTSHCIRKSVFQKIVYMYVCWDLPQPLCLWISRNYLKLLANLGKLFAICFPFTHILYIWICWSFRGSLILPDAGLMQAVAYTCIYCIDTVLRLLHYTDFVYLPVRTLKDKILRPIFSQFNHFRYYGLCVFALSVVSFSCCFAQLLPPCIRSCSPFLGFGPPMTSASGPTSHVQTEEACDGSFESWLLGLLSPCLPSPCLFSTSFSTYAFLFRFFA